MCLNTRNVNVLSMSEVVCEITEEGYIFRRGGQSYGPIVITEDVTGNDIAQILQCETKLVNDARWKTILEETEKEIDWDYLADILSSTIKKDKPTKLITFASMLLAQTEDSQFNIGLQAESSTGKSYIPLELTNYFPEDEVLIIAGASPTAFFHDKGYYDEENKRYLVDLEGKILVFLDQPHFQLLEKLRPLLSHDNKELSYKITDKNKGGSLRTKSVVLRGYPSVIFCTVKLDPDEQEKTRLFLLSPEVDEEKIRESLDLLAKKHGNRDEYNKMISRNIRLTLLKERITKIRISKIKHVIIPNIDKLTDKFYKDKKLKPRDQRDFPRIMSLMKAHALLNYFKRDKVGQESIICNETDIEAGFKLYEKIAEANELGLPPLALDIYNKVFVPIMTGAGVTRQDIERRYLEVYYKPLNYEFFKKYLKPALLAAGLISEEPDPDDKRKMLYYEIYRGNNRGYTPQELENLDKNNRNNINNIYNQSSLNISNSLGGISPIQSHLSPRIQTGHISPNRAMFILDSMVKKSLDGTILHDAWLDELVKAGATNFDADRIITELHRKGKVVEVEPRQYKITT